MRWKKQKGKTKETLENERLLALINSMGDAVITTDEQGLIKVYNAATLSLLDTNKELYDKSVDNVLALQDQKGNRIHLINELEKHDRVYSRTDLSHVFPDKEIARLYINVAPVRSENQHAAGEGYIFILRDITKEKTLEEERDEFISVVSHELRTPIAIAEGNLSNLSLLEERDADKKLKLKAANAAHEQILFLSGLINDLSTLSRAERSMLGDFEDIDVKSFIEHLYNSYEPQAKVKKLHLNLDLDPNAKTVHTSKLYLQELMQNLITNAIRYTLDGSITLKTVKSSYGIEFSVKDTGIGISKSDQKRVFEKFYRAEDYRTRETSGTGLGLYVCRKVAHKLGFSIEFESRLNHGSRFFFTVPPSPPKSKT